MLQIVAGEFKSKKLALPPRVNTRPVSQKVRAAIFNTLGDRVVGASVLDLYSGSGAIGLEALSRGADSVELVEKDNKAAQTIRKNIIALGADTKVKLINSDVEKFIASVIAQYDIVIIDPPYKLFTTTLVNKVASLVQYGGIIVVSCSSKSQLEELNVELEIVQHKTYGDTQIIYIERIAL